MILNSKFTQYFIYNTILYSVNNTKYKKYCYDMLYMKIYFCFLYYSCKLCRHDLKSLNLFIHVYNNIFT